MEYKVYKKVLWRKDNNAIIEEEAIQNLKRKDKHILKAKKRTKKSDHPWFRMKYKKPHTPLRLADTPLTEECYLGQIS